MHTFSTRLCARKKFLRIAALTGTALIGLQGVAAYAADTDETSQSSADESAERRGVQDIVVTAERRATNLQSTPLSIVAVTQEDVEAKGIEDLQDLARFTPNLAISPSRGNGASQANFGIRGIGGGGGATGERGVGLYVDGIYMPRTSGAVLRVLDIDRIEVLRGPQGTLFGRNSTGGAIRIFTKQPTDKFEGYVQGTYGNFDQTDVVGLINVPLGEGVAIRAQGAYLNQDGFVSRGTQMLGAQEDFIGRLQLRAEVSPNLTATLGFMYNDSRSNATPWVMEEFDMRPGIEGVLQGNYADLINDAFKAAGQAPLAPYNDSRIVKGDYAAPDICLIDDFNPDYDSACDQYTKDKYWQVDANIDWTLSDTVSVHSITGLSKLKHKAVTDWELIGAEMRYDNVSSDVFYQELQLNASLFGGKVDFVTGGSYFHEKSDAPDNYVLVRKGTSVYSNTGGSAGTPPDSDGGLSTRAIIYTKQAAKSYGLFATATWHITDRLNLTGGLRQAWDSKDYLQTRGAAADFTPAPGTTETTVSQGGSFHALDYRATLDYHFTDDIMAYATVSKAYKAGSFSYTILSNLKGEDQNAQVKPIPNEKLVNYEVGFRTTLFDRRLRLNPTAFLMHYTDRQAAIRVNCGTAPLETLVPGSASCPVGFLPVLQDQGDAWIRGIEVDAQLVLADGLTLDGSLGITDYTLKNVAPTTVYLNPDAPTPTYNVGATYDLDAGFGSATFNLNYAYVGKQSVYPDASVDSGYVLPAYGLVNARLQVRPKNVPVTITFFAKNLLDKVYGSYAQRFGGGFWDAGPPVGVAAPPRSALSVVRGRPREVGVTARFDF